MVEIGLRCAAMVPNLLALRSLRLCGNNLGVLGDLCDLCGYPRGSRLCATIRQFLRELRRIPSWAHRAFGGRLPPASPAAMRRLVAASPRWETTILGAWDRY